MGEADGRPDEVGCKETVGPMVTLGCTETVGDTDGRPEEVGFDERLGDTVGRTDVGACVVGVYQL